MPLYINAGALFITMQHYVQMLRTVKAVNGLHNLPKVQECDATTADITGNAGHKKRLRVFNRQPLVDNIIFIVLQ